MKKSLSEREIQVAEKLSDRLTFKEAGVELGISARTVRAHVERICTKLGARHGKSAKMVVRYYKDTYLQKK
jgi:DNA-binding CsgD family transcriptional regulator